MRWIGCALFLAGTCLWAQASAPAIPDHVAVERNIAYDQHSETVLDIYQPKAPALDRRPGVIAIHGGWWVAGNKDSMVPHCLRYVEQGFVCVSVGYRLAKAAPAPAAVTDVLNATKWFRDNANRYRVDRRRIVVTGPSAGGHLALMVGMVQKSARVGPVSNVAAVVNFYGITDVQDVLSGANIRKQPGEWIPDTPARYDLATRLSPISYVRKDVPPILTIHGDADEVVPYEHGTKLTRALQQAGATAEMVPVQQGAHGFPQAKLDELYTRHVWPFLRRNGILK
jgi:acetyl esterase/lipase